ACPYPTTVMPRTRRSPCSPNRDSLCHNALSRTQVVLAWLIGGKPTATPIVGVSTSEQLDEALAGARLQLPAEHRRLLDETV
uniref:aldo/keto reductase n=1 Tax=Streptomyces sp. CoT10 TaxID=2875762 RepID=UPI001CD45ABB